MAFKKLPKKELLRLAEEDFKDDLESKGLDVKSSDNKTEIVEKFEQAGVTWDDYEALFPEDPEPEKTDNVIRVPKPEDEVLPNRRRSNKKAEAAEAADDLVLVKMERRNPYFEVKGYTFTSRNPFQLVKEDDVDFLVTQMDGFRMATPKEVKEFYS